VIKFFGFHKKGETKMPRPRKCRKVCCLPSKDQFGPLNCEEAQEFVITMNVEEYETIRLIDLEGLTQEECAVLMKVARTTVQAIYNEARSKLAKALVLGYILRIEGGDYKVCDGTDKSLYCKECMKDKEN
jgi:predicted DNA-binding protein (UPF0251 family)